MPSRVIEEMEERKVFSRSPMKRAACRMAFAMLIFTTMVSLAEEKGVKPELVWRQAEDFAIEGRGWNEGLKSPYDRLPAKAEGKVSDAVWGLSHCSSGMCVRFATDAKTISVKWTLTNSTLSKCHMPATGVSGVDLYRRKGGAWVWAGNGIPLQFPVNTANFRVDGALTENLLYLPLYNGVTKVEIGVPVGCRLESAPQRPEGRRQAIVFYGSSITQGACASRPGMSFAAIIGRRIDIPVVNLGFSGSGKMELEMAGLIGEIDAKLYVIDCLWNMNEDLVKERVEPFIKALRSKRADVPILMVEDSNFRNICPTPKGKLVREIVEKLSNEGVQGLSVAEGRDLLGDDGEGTVDGCHPNDLGLMRHAEALTPVIKGLL